MSDRERRPDSERLIGRVPRVRINPPDDLFPTKPWGVTATRYAHEFLAQAETIYALANGYLGLRGDFEEGTPVSKPGVFLNGFYETWPIVYGEAAYGFAKTGQTIVNATDGKCCNFESGDGGGPEGNWAARSQAARSNSWSMNRFCLRTSSSLTHRACPFRIMCMASYPAIVRRAARNSRKLCLAFTRRLIAR